MRGTLRRPRFWLLRLWVARILMARYGPQANPDDLVTLRCEETLSIVEVARRSDAVVLTIRASAPDLIELPVTPALNAKARFGLVTMASRSNSPMLPKVRDLMRAVLRDVG